MKRKKRVSAGRKRERPKPTLTIEEARAQMTEAVCASCKEITEAIIVEAKQGKYLPAKFLFEAAGLTRSGLGSSDTGEEPRSLAELLLEPWGDEGAGEVTKETLRS